MSDPHETLRSDPHVGPLVERHGRLVIDPAPNFFERFVVSVIRQQVSMASAAATRERLFDAVEVTPDGILAADTEVLRNAGLSRQKTRYVKNIADAFVEREYDAAFFAEMDDEAVLDELTSITGVGTWTAKMQLMFSLGREDVFPVEDLGIRKGMTALFGEELNRPEMVERSTAWRPYRSYASLYLWGVEEGFEETIAEVRTD
ncbi:DNA-3-methyladenine glycosylase 2 family protein [Haloarculaceae archaeon H-GB2-1]|nr:DNA-3-methyladenine glycosylase 2 family protein [Haloarculaceae archaeon H-GB1-1]MEA5387192.1 DNA-3-methyladenine glycosylase 2 family protein [Haloarculaceae archaeon H-GB11]MEA5408687.1 DNA-3-methyladenine glycosylase 2 family protein [Haloarculaceae archaeon H-GB2-1]